MLPGNIDLTENLDFRLDKKDKFEVIGNSIPWVQYTDIDVFEKDTSIANDDRLIEDLSDIAINNATRFRYRYPGYNNYYYTFELGEDYYIIENTYSYNMSSYINVYNSLYETTTSIQSYAASSFYDDNIIIDIEQNNDGTFKVITHQIDNYDKLGLPYKNKEYDNDLPFIGKPKKVITSDTWYKRKTEDTYYSIYDYIPWEMDREYNYSRTKIPWETKEKKEEESERIPWLDNLSYRIYNDYIKDLFEEQDYSRYLTDMGWLGLFSSSNTTNTTRLSDPDDDIPILDVSSAELDAIIEEIGEYREPADIDHIELLYY